MSEQFAGLGDNPKSFSFTARDVVAIGYRHKRVLVLCFLGIFFGVLLSGLLLPSKYRAETRLLVKRDRVDPIVSSQQNAPVVFHDTVGEEEINSEMEMIQSHDVLQRAVEKAGLNRKSSLSALLHPFQTDQNRMDKAVADLRADLQLEVLKKTNVISIAYESHDPQVAQNVLAALNEAYLQKHQEVHNPTGQVKFFDAQSQQYKLSMMAAEEQLKKFADQQGGVAPTTMRDLTLQKLADFNSQLDTTRASIAESKKRIADLEGQTQSTPSRIATSVKKGDNASVLQTLKQTMLTLEMKRTELLTKYQPTYPLVQEVDKQLADTRAALAKEESSPVREETTDQNPTYSYLTSEVAKAKADLSGFEARKTALEAVVNVYMAKAKTLEQQGIMQQDLTRTAKANEENYLLYLKKGEEARIADALDQTRILNVAVAQPPTVPSLPTRSPWVFGMVGLLLATAVSAGVVLTLDYTDQSFRTPSEVLSELNIPVLGAVPQQGNGHGNGNGNGHGNGNGNGHAKSGSYGSSDSRTKAATYDQR